MTTRHVAQALRAAHAAKAEAIAERRDTGGLTVAIEALDGALLKAEWEERERGKRKARTRAMRETLVRLGGRR